ncbi:hypothetical protein FRB96_006767 [Tulasnella sp. 330]|nr:hypothetical protein FRB96_006767 [Tulasnella sp. 330]KAG8873614.1 hypothetical protein FRB97_006604 [Tulasnella sp. 331]
MVNFKLPLLMTAGVTGVTAFPAFAGKAGTASMEKQGGRSYANLSKRTEPVANVSGLVQVPDADHPFMAPGPTDQRGPCPGLNALANHGYLPHNGIVNSAQIIAATAAGFNMGPDLSAVLAAIALAFSGDPLTGLFSIGGYDARTSLLGTGLTNNILGYAGGLDYHSAGIEGDASATREDNYFGDDHTMQPTLYVQMKNFTNNYGGLYEIEPLKDAAEARRLNSIATNPDFYYLPLSAILGLGARGFPAYLFSNGTFGNGGVPNEESVSSFFGAQIQPDGTYKYVPERFPNYWYRRATPFTLVDVVASILDFQTSRDFSFGANAGAVNSFVPLDIEAATNINGTACIIQNAIQATVPSFANPLVTDVASIMATLLNTIAPYFAQFGCPPYDPSEAAAYAALSKNLVPGERK